MRSVLILSLLLSFALAQGTPTPPNCTTPHLLTDPDDGCKVCAPGFTRVVGTKPARILEDKSRILQGTKIYYICQKSTSDSIANCETMFISTDNESGCNKCGAGYGRVVSVPKLRLLEEFRMTQVVKTYYTCQSCSMAGCSDCGNVLNTKCLSCKEGFRESPSSRILEEHLRIIQSAPSLKTCQACSNGCKKCPSNQDICIECMRGFFQLAG